MIEKIIPNAAYEGWEENVLEAWSIWLREDQIPIIPETAEIPWFNQWLREDTKNSCTLTNAIRVFCHQTWYPFSLQLVLDVMNFAETLWYHIWEGWKTAYANDALYKFFNKKWSYVSLSKWDPLLELAYDRNNALEITYQWNYKRNQDSDDWVLNWVEFWKSSYWHATATKKYNWKKCVNDSYLWSKWNIYELEHFDELVWAKLHDCFIYTTFYLWLPKIDNAAEIIRLNKMKVATQKAIDWNSEARALTTEQAYKDKLHLMNIELRKKIDDILVEMKKLNWN